MMRSIRRAAIFLLAVICMLAFCLPAGARQLSIQSFDVLVEVHQDSTIEVTETLDVKFQGSWQGIYRNIPVEYRDSLGLNYTLFVEPKSVTDANGEALKYEVSRHGQYKQLKIYVPDAVDATRTIVIRYKVLDVLGFFP